MTEFIPICISIIDATTFVCFCHIRIITVSIIRHIPIRRGRAARLGGIFLFWIAESISISISVISNTTFIYPVLAVIVYVITNFCGIRIYGAVSIIAVGIILHISYRRFYSTGYYAIIHIRITISISINV